MNWPDMINGLFELFGGILLWKNVSKLYHDKQLRGVFWFPTAFFGLWGYWNLYYYPSLNQWASFSGGMVIVSANTAWVILALVYRRN